MNPGDQITVDLLRGGTAACEVIAEYQHSVEVAQGEDLFLAELIEGEWHEMPASRIPRKCASW